MTTHRDELDALMVKRALEGLDGDETQALETLLDEFGDVDPEWVDRLVGELDAASVSVEAQGLSTSLREAVLAAAPGASTDAGGLRTGALPVDSTTPARQARDTVAHAALTSTKTRRRRAWGGWAAAAAVAALWLGSASGSRESAPAFAAVATAPDAIVAEWAPGPDPTGAEVRGEVVWSSDGQAGVMRLQGLRVNAPDEYQYQLWIFDRDRDERYPVDGGVFDMPPGGEAAEVPIQAKLAVADPTLFAVTVEQPGGVVVSSRERIATVAEVTD